uniref:Osgepl1 protein n=1 Tax=Fopius arisanus TaxID=64838 RepID=A0A0C9QGG7_9HYME
MELAIVVIVLWTFFPVEGFARGIPVDPDDNISNEVSTMNIQISEYPGGHMLFITPGEVLPNSSHRLPVKNVSTSENINNCLHRAFNKTITNLQKQLTEISLKVSVLESKLERKLMKDEKNSPNILFIPPKTPESQTTDGSALDHLPKEWDNFEWMTPLKVSTTLAPEPPLVNLISTIIPVSSTPSPTQQQIDLLNRAKRKSEKITEGVDKKPKVLSLCARIIPVDEKRHSSISSNRRSKRTRREVLNNYERNLLEPMRYTYLKELGIIHSDAIKSWLDDLNRQYGTENLSEIDNVSSDYLPNGKIQNER